VRADRAGFGAGSGAYDPGHRRAGQAEPPADRVHRAPGRDRGTDLEVFFPDRGESAGPARQVCAACPVRQPCLDYASPEPWLTRHPGVLAPAASPALRAEYTRRAGTAAAYREAAGITDPSRAVSPEPHRSNPELEAMRRAVFTALEMRDEADILRGLDRGELEARALQGQRAHAAAPPDVSSQLRLTAQAEADAHQQIIEAQTCHGRIGKANATTLAATARYRRQPPHLPYSTYT
jgi:Transcription factor WhiB